MNQNRIYVFLCILFFSSVLFSAYAQNQNKQLIDATHPAIQYTGRVDFSNPKKAVFDFPAVYIRTRFTGTSCAIRLVDGNNWYNIIIDNQEPFPLQTTSDTVYQIAENLPDKSHSLIIFKRTEASVGKAVFKGFYIDKDAKLLKYNDIPERKIEFIGNSITCGYGNEGSTPDCDFSAQTENSYMSYASILARNFNADFTMIAYSGKGVVRNYGDKKPESEKPLPAYYQQTRAADNDSTWDFSRWQPDLVVINLGTNDFSTKPHPHKTTFIRAYSALISQVRRNYNNPVILCICGPFIGNPCCRWEQEIIEYYRAMQNAGDIYFVQIPKALIKNPDDLGCDAHPNIRGHKKMAAHLIPIVENIMNW